MTRFFRLYSMALASLLSLLLLQTGCDKPAAKLATEINSPLHRYMTLPDTSYHYELFKTIDGDKYTTHILRLVSGRWLTTNEVRNPEWWHWLHIVVPDSLASDIGLLFISGGSRKTTEPKDANEMIRAIALNTGSIAMNLHNVPNQPTEFVGDSYGPRSEDELIAYGWRQFMERGAEASQAEWLARLPMTRAAVRAMDAATDYVNKNLHHPLDRFVVTGASKRGWTTWTTAIVDKRVVAIAPIVIDLLNLVPSFRHHWRAYGAWSPAINDYVHEGIMDWMGSVEFDRLLEISDPYTYRQQLTLPKMIINASGDEFFLPDSWKFYWKDLVGEKHVRYVPNTGHSLKDTDALETVIAFHHSIIKNQPRPDFSWEVDNGTVVIQTHPQFPPREITLWQAVNDSLRTFRVDILGKVWTSEKIPLAADGHYRVTVEKPAQGWKAFFVELTFPGPGKFPFKQTTGVVVVPETLPFPEFKPTQSHGHPAAN